MDHTSPFLPGNPSSSSIRRIEEFKQPSSFAFYQTIRNGPATDVSVQTDGEITIKLSNRPGREKGIWVETQINTHDPTLAECVQTKLLRVDSAWDMVIETPYRALCRNTHHGEEDCRVTVNITIYVSRNLPLKYFLVKTQSLQVNIPAGIPVCPRTEVEISAPFTPLYFNSLTPIPPLIIHAFSTQLTTTSGSVKGDFRLSNSLSIHTTSGSIDINLDLVPSRNVTPTPSPAVLDIQSSSGSIAIRTRTISTPAQIPDRDYRTNIFSSSGSIAASLVHGTSATLHSNSGRIQASFHPHGNTTIRSDLYTRTLSGSQDIKIHPSLTDATAPLRNFFADYNGISGSLDISYPAQWEGMVAGSAVSGSIKAEWPGLKVIEVGNGAGNHTFKAIKGAGKGLLNFRAISGSLRLRGEDSAVAARPVAVDDAASSVTDTETLAGDDQHVLLTPQSEAGNEWMSVQ
ncbi:MAG: hypothetical protein Q9184_006300 [Pyrenodesmia sp. 2 TL-2023]